MSTNLRLCGQLPLELCALIAEHLSKEDLASIRAAASSSGFNLAHAATKELCDRYVILDQASPARMKKVLGRRPEGSNNALKTVRVEVHAVAPKPLERAVVMTPLTIPAMRTHATNKSGAVTQWLDLDVLKGFNQLRQLALKNVGLVDGTGGEFATLLKESCPNLETFELFDMCTRTKWTQFKLKGLKRVSWHSKHYGPSSELLSASRNTIINLSVNFYDSTTAQEDFDYFCLSSYPNLQVLKIIPPHDKTGTTAGPDAFFAPIRNQAMFLVQHASTFEKYTLGNQASVQSFNSKLDGWLKVTTRATTTAPALVQTGMPQNLADMTKLKSLQCDARNVCLFNQASYEFMRQLTDLEILARPVGTAEELIVHQKMIKYLKHYMPPDGETKVSFGNLEALTFLPKVPRFGNEEDENAPIGGRVGRIVEIKTKEGMGLVQAYRMMLEDIRELFPKLKTLRINPPPCLGIPKLAKVILQYPRTLKMVEIVLECGPKGEVWGREERNKLQDAMKTRRVKMAAQATFQGQVRWVASRY